MKVFDMPQYSTEWYEVRRGIPTASRFDRIMTPTTKKLSASADKLAYELIAEKVRFDPNMMTEGPMTPAMRAGLEGEDEARRYYSFHSGHEVKQVGFCLSDCGRFGCSPDALVNDDGVLELKVPEPKTHVEYLCNGVLPPAYACQCHGHLVVTGRKFCDFMSYSMGFPAFTIRVTPDSFTDQLRVCLEMFSMRLAELAAMLAKRVP